MEELEAQYEGERYRWSCPVCGEVWDDENDIRNDDVECESCDWKGKCSS